MPEITISSALAQVFALTASGGYASRVRVTRGSNYSVDVVPTGTKYFRTYLCGSAGTGASATDPQEFLAYVEGLFNAAVAGWTLSMRADGRVGITNSAGTFAVPWTGAHASGAIVRNLLGFASDIAATAAGVVVVGDYAPTHLLLTGWRANDEGWKAERPMGVYEQMDDETQYGWDSGYVRRSRSFDLSAHPTDAAAAASRDNPSSPLHAVKTRWKQPTLAPAVALTPPWSIEDFVYTSGGYNLGAALGTWRALVDGTATEIDVVTLSDRARERLDAATQVAGLSTLRTVKGLKLHWYGTETL
jgi:hypothetical protein